MINKVTSLADLFFKAKTDKRYERLIILTAKQYGLGEPITTVEQAMKRLDEQSLYKFDCGVINCNRIVDVANSQIGEVEWEIYDKKNVYNSKKYNYDEGYSEYSPYSYEDYEIEYESMKRQIMSNNLTIEIVNNQRNISYSRLQQEIMDEIYPIRPPIS